MNNITIKAGESLEFTQRMLIDGDPLKPRDLTGAKIQFICPPGIVKATANVAGGAITQIAIADQTGASVGYFTIYVLAADTLITPKAYPFQLWVEYPGIETHCADEGMILIGASLR